MVFVMAQLPRPQVLPPLEWLRVFEAAARLENFSNAARELGLTQAAVSQRIRNLEVRLGKPLFTRLPRGVELTVEGEAYAPHVRSALTGLTRCTADLFSTQKHEITIAASASMISHWITPRLPKLISRLPDLKVSMVTVHRANDFSGASADFEIRFGDGNWPDQGAVKLFDEILAPVAALSSVGRSPKDWRSLPTIALSGPRHGWLDWAEATKSEPPRTPSLRFDTFSQALNAAALGQGVLLASLALVERELSAGKLIRLPEACFRMEDGYWLTWSATEAAYKNHSTIVGALQGN